MIEDLVLDQLHPTKFKMLVLVLVRTTILPKIQKYMVVYKKLNIKTVHLLCYMTKCLRYLVKRSELSSYFHKNNGQHLQD